MASLTFSAFLANFAIFAGFGDDLNTLGMSQYGNIADDTAWTGKNFMFMIIQKEQKLGWL